MLFSSNIFLFLFLPATLIGYYLLPKALKNIFLLLMSLGFYAWGEPRFVLVMIASITFNYAAAFLVSLANGRAMLRKILLFVCVLGNLGLLFTYKYLGFFTSNLNSLGLDISVISFALPIGISFFTFQAMSYVIDVYRNDVSVQKKPWNVGLYIALFPQLIAGPIVRYKDVEQYIVSDRKVSFEQFGDGVQRFIIGLSKKVLLANNMALIADHAFGIPDAERSVLYAWCGAVAYSFQIFFDFSGYSDMAIGLGKMFGFKFLENFNYPYISKSVSEFWRRWHMSLGRWFRDYVYFPLGGSRVNNKGRLVFNLFVTWILTGIWHGASWNFVIWGLMYFALIAFEKLSGWPDKLSAFGKILYRVFTLLCVVLGWVVFRAVGGAAAAGYLLSMFGRAGNPIFCDFVFMTFREYWLFLVLALLLSTELPMKTVSKLTDNGVSMVRLISRVILVLLLVFCFFWSVSFIIMDAYNPFIYFNF